MKNLCILFAFLFAALFVSPAFAQWKGKQAPEYLAEEIYRLSKDCYYFKEFLLIKQGSRYLVAVVFLAKEGIEKNPKAISHCGKRSPQVRLYRWINDRKVVFKDSVFIDAFGLFLGNASDFDGSGTTKFIINQSCNVPQGASTPLLCYAFSVYEITKKEKLRNTLFVGNVPERYMNGQPQGIPLEPVVTDNFDKTSYPECLAIDDFFEGDPAFRSDDFPKLTLVYTWDPAAKVYKHHSDKFPDRFGQAASIESIPPDITLVGFMETAMAIAAIGKHGKARAFIESGMTNESIERWRAADSARAGHINPDRLKNRLLICIDRYKTNP